MRVLRRVLRGLVQAMLLAVCAALFYLLVIMGDTNSPDMIAQTGATPAPLASLPQSPMVFSEDTLYQALYYFNAPALTLGGKEWKLQHAQVADILPEGVDTTVREVRLRYENADGAVVDVSSLTPGRVLRGLPERGFVAALDQEWMLAGAKAVFMKSGDALHLHIQRDEVVYQIEGNVSMEALRKAASAAEL